MLFNKALAGFLGLASLGAASQHEDRADRALKLGGRQGGIARRHAKCIGTGTAAPTATPTTTCEVPDPTANPVDWDAEVCKCGPYKGGFTYGPYTINNNWYEYIFGGYARFRCNQRYPAQTKVVPNNASFQDCIYACSGSFEKAKRAEEAGLEVRQSDEYWFCHAVNFKQGELCEFVGEIKDFTYTAGGSDCWIYPSFNPGSG
ncbi:hypothetical protein ONZ43_g5803 [Nemania bipapillata]|uniref:Uncharacterized protein n=1 Tax=Nemania bipapillata TaxID=110536 RepID=A0ACC2I6C9_9PEZI|nr:hypothetical protein ONZ43_g5803 [Nemania bipapillata]